MAAPDPRPAPPPGLIGPDRLDAAARHAGDVWLPDHPYFAAAEAVTDPIWRSLVQRQIEDCDFTHVLDLASGIGRNAAKLLPLCRRLTLVDIRPENIDRCRARFGDDPRITYLVTNGYGLAGVPDGSVTLLFCFDAMVHFDSDVVRAYLAEARRVLARGGRAFLHHSNHEGGEDWLVAPHNRAFMSKALMGHYARKEGLGVVRQTVLEWGGVPALDCMTVLERP